MEKTPFRRDEEEIDEEEDDDFLDTLFEDTE